MRERIAVFLCEFLFFYRAENLCYQFGHGQELKPQFRKIVCLVCACFARKRINENFIQGGLINGMCLFADGTRAARRREYERRA